MKMVNFKLGNQMRNMKCESYVTYNEVINVKDVTLRTF